MPPVAPYHRWVWQGATELREEYSTMQTTAQQPAPPEPSPRYQERTRAYDQWVAAQGIPIHTGYFVDDIRTVELGWWEARQCNGAILALAGQEGVSDVHLTEIPAGRSAAPISMAM